MAINERIRRIRISKEMTQQQVADIRLAKALDVSVTELLDFTEKEQTLILRYESVISEQEKKLEIPKSDQEEAQSNIDVANKLIESYISYGLAKEAVQIFNEQCNAEMELIKKYENQKQENQKRKDNKFQRIKRCLVCFINSTQKGSKPLWSV